MGLYRASETVVLQGLGFPVYGVGVQGLISART